MIISKLILHNWKNFQHCDVKLSARVFIVGANASGKSNLLDVFRFMRDIVKQAGGLQHAVEERGGVSKIRCLAARAKSDISIEVHLSESENIDPDWKYSLTFKTAKGSGGIFKTQAAIVQEKVWSKKDGQWVLQRKASDAAEDEETLKFTFLEQPNSNTKFREIYHFFRESQYLHVVPQLVRDADSYMLSAKKEDYYGRNLLDKMSKTPKNTRDAYMRRINEVLQIAVPQLKDIKFEPDDKGVPHLEAVYVHWRPQGAKQQESQFSDGTLRLIGFMWALLDGQETILLEEPELYLHTAIVKLLPEFISRMQKKKNRIRQVIMTTHSIDLLSNEGIGAEEVIILKPTSEGSEVNRAEDIQEIKTFLDSGFSMAEAVIPSVAPNKIEKILQLKIWE